MNVVVSALSRANLIQILQDGPQGLRPPRLHRQAKADLVEEVERGLKSERHREHFVHLIELAKSARSKCP